MKKFFLLLFLLSISFLAPQNVFAHGEAIHLTNQGFEPSETTIEKGETVEFENIDTSPHWPASDIHPTHEIYPAFDPKRPLGPGEKWSFTFDQAGRWQMHDHLLPQFTGVIIVQGEETAKVEKLAKKNKNFFQKVADGAKVFGYKAYYKFFPAKLAKVEISKSVDKEEEIELLIRVLSPEGAFAKLLTESGGGTAFDCHRQAHIIGRVSYEIYGSEVFGKGDSSCHSGYYHGAMESFLAEEGTKNLSSKIMAICNKFATSFGNFECLHGVGHGVMAYENYDLPKAIDICSQLSNSFEQESCYGGVFMENIVASQGNGAIVNHSTSWISNDPRYPCTIFGNNGAVVRQCYMMQTSRMLELFSYDFSKVAEECLKIEFPHTAICYQSMGRDAAGYTLRNSQKTIQICDAAPNEFKQNCYAGALNVIVDFWGEKLTTQADDFCSILAEDHKTPCQQLLEGRKIDVFGKNSPT